MVERFLFSFPRYFRQNVLVKISPKFGIRGMGRHFGHQVDMGNMGNMGGMGSMRRRRGCGSRRVGDTLERIPRSRVGSRVLRLWAIAAHALTESTCAVF